mmetsp:Transcript_43262/g.119630  ORF Transcript_43262/g.119630 Transcript_43262/m.119630 type:complete len:252 (-) Transcript_43262:166-921(-)
MLHQALRAVEVAKRGIAGDGCVVRLYVMWKTEASLHNDEPLLDLLHIAVLREGPDDSVAAPCIRVGALIHHFLQPNLHEVLAPSTSQRLENEPIRLHIRLDSRILRVTEPTLGSARVSRLQRNSEQRVVRVHVGCHFQRLHPEKPTPGPFNILARRTGVDDQVEVRRLRSHPGIDQLVKGVLRRLSPTLTRKALKLLKGLVPLRVSTLRGGTDHRGTPTALPCQADMTRGRQACAQWRQRQRRCSGCEGHK